MIKKLSVLRKTYQLVDFYPQITVVYVTPIFEMSSYDLMASHARHVHSITCCHLEFFTRIICKSHCTVQICITKNCMITLHDHI